MSLTAPQSINLDQTTIATAKNTGGAAGTGSTNVAVIEFSADADIVAPGGFYSEERSAQAGTVLRVTRAGLYMVSLMASMTGAATAVFGISKNVAAGGLTADPAFATAGMLAVAPFVGTAGGTFGSLLTIPVTVRLEEAAGQGAALRFHATNGAGAAPAAMVGANVWYEVAFVQPIYV